MRVTLHIAVPHTAGVKRQRATPDGSIALGKLLGSGSQGQVRIGKVLASRQRVAVKVMARRSSQARNEVEVLARLPAHRHVVGVAAGCRIQTSASQVFVPMPLADTDMLEALLLCRRFAEADARRYFRHLVTGVAHCHAHGVYHLDIKPENVLLVDGRAVLADFGSALSTMQQPAMADYPSGSISNAAPEVIGAGAQPYAAAAADVWSLGVLLFVMATGRPPWAAARPKDRNYAAFLDGSFAWPAAMNPELRRLLETMLRPEAADRPPLRDVLAHPWLTPRAPASHLIHRRACSAPDAISAAADALHAAAGTLDDDDLLLGLPAATCDSRRTCSTASDVTMAAAVAVTPKPEIVVPHVVSPAPPLAQTVSGADAVAAALVQAPRLCVRAAHGRFQRRRLHRRAATAGATRTPGDVLLALSPRTGPVKRRAAPAKGSVPQAHPCGGSTATGFAPLSPMGKRSAACFLSHSRRLATASITSAAPAVPAAPAAPAAADAATASTCLPLLAVAPRRAPATAPTPTPARDTHSLVALHKRRRVLV